MRRVIFLLLLTIPLISVGQTNLVVNPSFEDTFRCPSDSSVTKAKYWYNPTICGSPDYFYPTMTLNAGCPEQMVTGNLWGGGGYSNNWGDQLPRSGVAYAGMGVEQGTELMADSLSDSMRLGKKYAVSFFTSLGEAYYSQGAEGLDLIAICFMNNRTTNYNSSTCWTYLGSLHADAGNSSGNFLTDTLNWMLVQDTFIAHGGERFFVLGNIDTANTLYFNSPVPTACYYYFDDFDIHCVDCSTSVPETPGYPEISLTPSLSNGEFLLKGNFPTETKLEIFNMLGQRLSDIEVPQGTQSFPVSLQLAEGVYVYRVNSNGQRLKEGKLEIVK